MREICRLPSLSYKNILNNGGNYDELFKTKAFAIKYQKSKKRQKEMISKDSTEVTGYNSGCAFYFRATLTGASLDW
jgi:hypothetical protein